MSDIIRVLLTLAIVGGVYHETGWITALAVFLIAARCEVQDFVEGRTFQ